LNLILDILFVKYLHMGTSGAALATIIGQAVAFIYALIYLYKRKEAFGFDFKRKSFAIDKTAAAHLSRLGVPLAIQSAAINLSMMYVNSLVNQVHVTGSSTFGTGVKIDDVVNRITYGLTLAGSSMIGQNVAANKQKRAASVINWILIFSGIFYAVFTVVLLLFSEELFGFFKREEDVINPEYIEQFVIAAIISLFVSPVAFSISHTAIHERSETNTGKTIVFIRRSAPINTIPNKSAVITLCFIKITYK
jgi:Na+-driven multidrug efflux pump